MAQQLIFTSAERGLDHGSNGLCVVARTKGMSQNLQGQLNVLHNYAPLDLEFFQQARHFPVIYSHVELPNNGKESFHAFSSNRAAGSFDAARRVNLAQHWVFDSVETKGLDLAALFANAVDPHSKAELFMDSWKGEPQELDPKPFPGPKGFLQNTGPKTWKNFTGNVGWAARLVEWTLDDSISYVRVIYPRDCNVCTLVDEALRLMPVRERWRATFSTCYLRSLPPSIKCRWRFILAGSENAENGANADTHGQVHTLDLRNAGNFSPSLATSSIINLANASLVTSEVKQIADELELRHQEVIKLECLLKESAEARKGIELRDIVNIQRKLRAVATSIPMSIYSAREEIHSKTNQFKACITPKEGLPGNIAEALKHAETEWDQRNGDYQNIVSELSNALSRARDCDCRVETDHAFSRLPSRIDLPSLPLPSSSHKEVSLSIGPVAMADPMQCHLEIIGGDKMLCSGGSFRVSEFSHKDCNAAWKLAVERRGCQEVILCYFFVSPKCELRFNWDRDRKFSDDDACALRNCQLMLRVGSAEHKIALRTPAEIGLHSSSIHDIPTNGDIFLRLRPKGTGSDKLTNTKERRINSPFDLLREIVECLQSKEKTDRVILVKVNTPIPYELELLQISARPKE